MQTDPIGFGGGMNLYAYVGNDSVNLIDPFGLFVWRTLNCTEVPFVDDEGFTGSSGICGYQWVFFFQDGGGYDGSWQGLMRAGRVGTLAGTIELLTPVGNPLSTCEAAALSGEYSQPILSGVRVYDRTPFPWSQDYAVTLPSTIRPGGSNIYLNGAAGSPSEFYVLAHEVDHSRTYYLGTETPLSIAGQYIETMSHDQAPAEISANAARDRVSSQVGLQPC